MAKIYKASKQSILAKNPTAHCVFQASRWNIMVNGMVLGSSEKSAKEAWINARENRSHNSDG